MTESYDKLIEKYLRYGKQTETERIRRAYDIAAEAHEGQMRKGGDPYISHPLAVADIVADMELDADSIISALLHDTVEDTELEIGDIKKQFGATVADIVDGLTKLDTIQYSSKEEQEMENLRKMFIAMARDIRVILIKLADRLHNMRTIGAKEERKQREKALETMDIYTPIAHRLGTMKIKWELEDLCLRCLDPIGYREITDALVRLSDKSGVFLQHLQDQVRESLDRHEIKAHIEGRIKHIYSIYRKLYSQNRTIDEIYDLYALRIIVDTPTECYNVLGVMHDAFRPLPGRFKDYISTPKPNMYQSLHTTLIGRDGVPFEMQIRTWDMHRVAEFGIAAHWKYKQGVTGTDSLDDKLAWVRRMLETQAESGDAEDFLKSFKIDLFNDEVYVFTPKGDVINLPAGSTPIDFAYAIHSAVGNRMNGAKVNGRMITLETPLQNGDVVEILTSNSAKGPGRDWLKIAKTNEARNKIKQWYKKEKRDENIVTGREELERELRYNGIPVSGPAFDELIQTVLKRLFYNTYEELCASIGYGGITVTRVINRVREEIVRRTKENQQPENIPVQIDRMQKTGEKSNNGVVVKGIDNCLIKFARCCTPIPGDPIVGFVTRGHGVSVHCANCANVTSIINNDNEDKDRLIEVGWDYSAPGKYQVEISVIAGNRSGLIVDITTALANMHINLRSLNAKEVPGGKTMVAMITEVEDTARLEAVSSRLRRVGGVIDVIRGS